VAFFFALRLQDFEDEVLAILVSSVMFFSFSSAMVMIHLNPFAKTFDRSAVTGDFQRRVLREDKNNTTPGRKAGLG
jgi:hypothetical protein